MRKYLIIFVFLLLYIFIAPPATIRADLPLLYPFYVTPDYGAGIGSSVSMDGEYAAVGGNNADSGAPAVVILKGSGVEPREETAVVTPSDWTGAAYQCRGCAFGWYSVAISGDTLVVGASVDSVDSYYAPSRGAIYVYERNGEVWGNEQKILASDGVGHQQFGYSVAIDGDTIVVGVAGDLGSAGGVNSKAYIFQRDGEDWIEQAILTPISSDVQIYGFGHAVDIDGDTVIVGSYHYSNPTPGSAFIYVRDGETWTQQAMLTPSDGNPQDDFGIEVAISGDTVLVGAPRNDWTPTPHDGAAYVFERSGSIWTETAKLVDDALAGGDGNFGLNIAVDDEIAVIGDGYHGPIAYKNDGDGWIPYARLGINEFSLGGPIAIFGDIAVLKKEKAGSTDQIAFVRIHNRPPEANPDLYTVEAKTDFDTALLGEPSVLANDVDIDAMTVTTTPVVSPTQGELTLNADGSFIYAHSGNSIGTDTFVYEVCDTFQECGTAEVTLQIVDLVPPVALCKSLTVYLWDENQVSIQPSEVDNGSTDNLALDHLSLNQSTFGVGNLGINIVTLTATDTSGNSDSCEAMVTVQDAMPPIINCPANIMQNAAPGATSAVVTYPVVTATDNATTPAITQLEGLASGSAFPIGGTTNIFVATDEAGNTATCNFMVTVNETLLTGTSITVTKVVNWYGEVGDESFTIVVSGPEGYTEELYFGSQGGSQTLNDLDPGVYTVNELVPDGWTPDQNDFSVEIAENQTTEVIITNTEDAPQIVCDYSDDPNAVLSTSDIGVTFDDGTGLFTATATVSNTSDCEYEVGMAAYYKTDYGWLADYLGYQELVAWDPAEITPINYTGQFDGNTRVLNDAFAVIVPPANGETPGTVDLSVSFGQCATQVDVVFDASHNIGFGLDVAEAATVDLVPLILPGFNQNSPAWGGSYGNNYSNTDRLLRAFHYDNHNFGDGWVDLPLLPDCGEPQDEPLVLELAPQDDVLDDTDQQESDAASLSVEPALEVAAVEESPTVVEEEPAVEETSVVESAAITGFEIVDTSGNELSQLTNAMVIDTNAIVPYSIVATTNGVEVGSVVFNLIGETSSFDRVENNAPYALGGDSDGSYFPVSLLPGTYILTATPYSEADGQGESGESLSISFSVINNTVVIEEAPVAEEPMVEEAVPEETVVEEPIVEDTLAAEEPVAEEPAVEESVAEEPAVEEPTVEETSAAEESVAEEPATEEPSDEASE